MRIKIDDLEIEFSGTKTILELAREKGIYIPSLCDHPLLKPFGGCRLCLVEIKGARGYVPACTRLAEDGLEVITSSPDLEEMRRQTLELILSEHPNACLVCSEKENCEEHKITIRKVGEVTGCVFCPKDNHCELQQVVQYLGIKKVRFPSSYRGFEVIREDPFFDRNYNLCILCGRCVRICHEVRGAGVISFVFRGSQTVIGTAYNQPLLDSGCQFCGACVDVCPVGALSERSGRAELKAEREVITVCPFCSQACLLKIRMRGERILASEPASLESLGKMCVRGRFLTRDLVHNHYRLLQPYLRSEGELRETGWDEALEETAARLASYSGEKVALILSPHLPLEDLYALTLLAQRGLKTGNLALSTINETYLILERFCQENELSLNFNYKAEEVAEAESILILGGDLTTLQPGLWVEVFQAISRGARLITLDPISRPYDRLARINLKILPEAWPAVLARWLELAAQKAGLNESMDSLNREIIAEASAFPGEDSIPDDFREKVEEAFGFLAGKKSLFLIGPGFWPLQGEEILPLLLNLINLLGARVIPFGHESNSRAAMALFKRLGLRLLSWSEIDQKILNGEIKALLCFGPLPYQASRLPECVVMVEPYRNRWSESAQVLLPAATVLERSGTFVASNGQIKRFGRTRGPLGESRPDWWIAGQIGKRLDRDFPVFASEEEILKEMEPIFPELKELVRADLSQPDKVGLTFLAEEPARMKLIKPLARKKPVSLTKKGEWRILVEAALDHYRSLPLALVSRDFRRLRRPKRIWLHPLEAGKFQLVEGDRVRLKNEKLCLEALVKVSSRVPPGILLFNSGSAYLPEYPASLFLSSCFSRASDGSLVQEIITIERGN
jgi:predicted molibdopterin-dependent oxidoreductase YjgC